jgi:hypothetical protein
LAIEPHCFDSYIAKVLPELGMLLLLFLNDIAVQLLGEALLKVIFR